MFRPVLHVAPLSTTRHPQRWQESWARLLAPFTLWICVSVILRYGYYGDCRMVLGPSSSRLVEASSLFVEQVEARDDNKKGVLLYAFSEKPELSHETNWSFSNFIVVGSYSRQGFSLWLNKGSRIHVRWEARASILNKTRLVIIKGERKFETLWPKQTSSSNPLVLTDPINGKDTEYTVEEADRYYFGVINMNPRSIILTMSVNVTSKLYDLTKANNMCSTSNGWCRLKLSPSTRFLILTTPNNGDLNGWYIELSFVARVITYIAILGFIIVMIFLLLKYLGACADDTDQSDSMDTRAREVSETDPILPEKPVQFTYGTTTNEQDDDSGSSSSSSEDLYDAKLCVICYDDQRNCFFVPCGHCATCYECAQRIMEGDSKMCPICRRLIHKVRRLFSP